MDELEMTPSEIAQITRVCTWVRITPGLLPYLRAFLTTRLFRRNCRLAQRVGDLTKRQIFFLWQQLKEEQDSPRLFPEESKARPFDTSSNRT